MFNAISLFRHPCYNKTSFRGTSMPKWRLYEHSFVENHPQPDKYIIYATTIMSSADKKYGDLVRPSEAPRIITSDDIQLNQTPPHPIIKMASRSHVDDFFNNGILQLGSFEYYSNHENDEVRDDSESLTVIVGLGQNVVTVSKIGAGYDYRVFCCYTGLPSEDVMGKFGYDDGYEILDPKGFLDAISQCLNSDHSGFGQCAYVDRKVVSVPLSQEFDPTKLDHTAAFEAEVFRYFLKPERYRHQQETRFIWKLHADVKDAVILKCPAAVNYCRRL